MRSQLTLNNKKEDDDESKEEQDEAKMRVSSQILVFYLFTVFLNSGYFSIATVSHL